MTAREVAQRLIVDPATVRRWPARGCPVVRAGGRGPGRATLFDLDQVRRWRGKVTASSGMRPDEALRLIAVALRACFENNCAVRAGCEREDAAFVLFLAFEHCCLKFKHRFAFDAQPEAIRALARIFVK